MCSLPINYFWLIGRKFFVNVFSESRYRISHFFILKVDIRNVFFPINFYWIAARVQYKVQQYDLVLIELKDIENFFLVEYVSLIRKLLIGKEPYLQIFAYSVNILLLLRK